MGEPQAHCSGISQEQCGADSKQQSISERFSEGSAKDFSTFVDSPQVWSPPARSSVLLEKAKALKIP